MVTQHTEVEQKYDVEGAFVLPDAAGLAVAGVASVDPPLGHDLEAVYHDTPDLRLARARVTLRRRTGGADAGWHLKLPGADGARRELHAPLGRSVRTPPRALLAPVAGVLRGARTGPVATLRNHRVVTVLRDAEGRALAEVADDTVTASASAQDGAAELQAWREVEVELVDGEASLLAALGERLVEAGARPSGTSSKLARVLSSRLPEAGSAALPGADGRAQVGTKGGRKAGKQAGKKGGTAGDVLLAAVRTQVQELEQADIALRLGEPDAVHRLRVSARRLRSILAAFGEVLDREVTEPLRGELSWLGGELGTSRDDEVALGHLRALLAAQPPELALGPVAARLQQAMLRSDAGGRERALATLSEDRHLRLLDGLHALLEQPPSTAGATDPAGPALQAAVRSAAKRLRRRVDRARAVDGNEVDAALHEIRKAAKRARYTAEVARTAGTDAAPRRTGKKLHKASTRVHRVLGELQDTVVTRDRAHRLGIEAAQAGENAFPYGLLHGLETGRAERARAAFGDLAGDLCKGLRALARR